ncbi:hypothetical protein [Burkholderia plantarii]|uniref:hypothetical protein n=1 Tax=Burkholderia plantarii TaxID=41899 RepID=UPI0018DEB32D|nr:hypothetical protein [Burkholderia plantarii]MBI0330436.1 hypothetical protein [Burkholderia plantarii]
MRIEGGDRRGFALADFRFSVPLPAAGRSSLTGTGDRAGASAADPNRCKKYFAHAPRNESIVPRRFPT